MVVKGEVEPLGFAEWFLAAVWLDEFEQRVLAAQGDAQRAQCVAVVGIVEKVSRALTICLCWRSMSVAMPTRQER